MTNSFDLSDRPQYHCRFYQHLFIAILPHLLATYQFRTNVALSIDYLDLIIYRGQIEMHDHYHRFDDEALFVKNKFYRWGEHRKRLYAHMYYNAYRTAIAKDEFMRKLLDCKQEPETNQRTKRNEVFYSKYFNA